MRGRVMIFTLVIALGTLIGDSSSEDTLPVARWDFGTEELTRLSSHGGVKRDQAGPAPPEFPYFAKNNTAVYLDGQGAHLALSDPGAHSDFDFAQGDAITLEAWVRLDGLRDGHLLYVLGKGRTGDPRYARDNQNWAMRVAVRNGIAKVSFLFATSPLSGDCALASLDNTSRFRLREWLASHCRCLSFWRAGFNPRLD